jgi:hypothetical protein
MVGISIVLFLLNVVCVGWPSNDHLCNAAAFNFTLTSAAHEVL